jgi:hypothetical protein
MHITVDELAQVERVLIQDYWYSVVPGTFWQDAASHSDPLNGEFRFKFYAKGGRQVNMRVWPEQVDAVQLDEPAR